MPFPMLCILVYALAVGIAFVIMKYAGSKIVEPLADYIMGKFEK